MKKLFVATAIAAAIAVFPPSSLACSAVGPDKHVGVLLGIDSDAQTITVLDAQSGQPMTFIADEQILNKARSAKGQVIVDFAAEGSKLRATGIEY